MSGIHHSICRWCYSSIPLEDLCLAANRLGIKSIELVMPADFATLKKHGLTCAMVSFPTGKTLTGTTVGTIRENYEFISHYHTGGCPGRNEIDETQELFYPAIMRTIAATGYRGFVGQEFIPTAEDALSSLKKAMEI